MSNCHRAVNNQACSCGWTAKKNGYRGWQDRCYALQRHLKEKISVTTSPNTCGICGASWTAPVSDCPVCTDPAIVAAIQTLTDHGIDGTKYDQLLQAHQPDMTPRLSVIHRQMPESACPPIGARDNSVEPDARCPNIIRCGGKDHPRGRVWVTAALNYPQYCPCCGCNLVPLKRCPGSQAYPSSYNGENTRCPICNRLLKLGRNGKVPNHNSPKTT